MDYGLKDKVVLITGSTGGIGQALTRAFAREGSKLAISSTKQEKLDKLIPTLGLPSGQVKGYVVDVTKEADIKAFVEQASKDFGRVDVMVIDAGVEGENKQIVDSSVEDYEKVYAVNLYAPVLCIKYAAQRDAQAQARSHRHHRRQTAASPPPPVWERTARPSTPSQA
jgi:NAD(P)-dependent dehydrogenase (short-subunit alcohol dehydrogenase family)